MRPLPPGIVQAGGAIAGSAGSGTGVEKRCAGGARGGPVRSGSGSLGMTPESSHAGSAASCAGCIHARMLRNRSCSRWEAGERPS